MTESWTCPTCSRAVSTPYCPACGESPPTARDLTLRGFSLQLFHALSSIDGRLIRSFLCLLRRPGALTVAYVQGKRVPYVGPVQVFLLANLLFFAIQSLTGANVFSSTLNSHLHQQDWSGLAQELVARRLLALNTTLEVYAPEFNEAVLLNAKSLIVLMVLPFTLLLPVLFYKNRQPFAVHAVFALHLYAFLLLAFCVSLVISAIDTFFGGTGLQSARMDNVLSLINLGLCGLYLYVATGTVYGARGVPRVLKVAALTATVAAILLGYRFALFLITLYTT